jgi:hypothetical protein
MNRFHGVSLNVKNGARVEFNDFEISRCKEVNQWYLENGFRVTNDLWQNKLLIFEREDAIDISEILYHVYDSKEPYTKNLRAGILRLSRRFDFVCPYKMCKRVRLKMNEKNRYICGNCGHVTPKEIQVVHAYLGDNDRSSRVYCYEELAERLLKEHRKGDYQFLFRISGILENVKVKFIYVFVKIQKSIIVVFSLEKESWEVVYTLHAFKVDGDNNSELKSNIAIPHCNEGSQQCEEDNLLKKKGESSKEDSDGDQNELNGDKDCPELGSVSSVTLLKETGESSSEDSDGEQREVNDFGDKISPKVRSVPSVTLMEEIGERCTEDSEGEKHELNGVADKDDAKVRNVLSVILWSDEEETTSEDWFDEKLECKNVGDKSFSKLKRALSEQTIKETAKDTKK